MSIEMLSQEVESGKYDDQYADYIMEHSSGDRLICDGDTLIVAMEDGYLFDDFVEHLFYNILKKV